MTDSAVSSGSRQDVAAPSSTPPTKRPAKKQAPSFAQTAMDFESHRRRVIDGAVYLHGLGLSIFSLPLNEKNPRLNDRWKGLADKRILLEDIPVLFAEPSNVGIVCGGVSQVTVMDVDGDVGWNHLKESLGVTYDTIKHLPHVRTNGLKANSYHFYFKFADNHYTRQGTKRALIGVDIRSKGGYVVAPPSVHPKSGVAYEWIVPITEIDALPEMDPAWEQVFFTRRSADDRAHAAAESSLEEAAFFAQPLRESPRELGEQMADILRPYWVEGTRHSLNLYVVGFLRKCKIPVEQTHEIIETICKCCDDYEVSDRLTAITTTYDKPEREIKGSSGLDEIMNCEDLSELRKLFVFNHRSPMHKAGFDRRGVYKIVQTKEETVNQYVLQGRFEFKYCKHVHRHAENIDDKKYVFAVNGKDFEVRARELAEPRKFLYEPLFNNGVSVSLADIAVVSELMNSCAATMDYPTYNYYTYMGWINDDLVVPHLGRRDNILESPHLFRGWNDARGSLETLSKCYTPDLVRAFPPLFAAIGHVVISPFLQPLQQIIPRIRNGFLNLVGPAGGGKSSLGRAAMAFWGDPEAIKLHWHATINSLEYSLRKNDIFPVFLDELSTASEKMNFQQFIYMVEQGKGKGRAKWDSASGDTEENLRKGWCLNVLSTGEESIKHDAREGVDSRIIELGVSGEELTKTQRRINDLMGYRLSKKEDDTPWADADLTKFVPRPAVNSDRSGHNFGWGMRALLKYLERPGGKSELMSMLVNAYELVERDLIARHKRVQHPGVNDRLVTNWTCIALGYLLCHKLMGYKTPCTVSFLGDMVEACWQYVHTGAPSCNDPENVYQTYCSYYYAKRELFATTYQEFKSNRGVGYIGFTEICPRRGMFFYVTQDAARKIEREAGLKATSVQQDRLIASGRMESNEPKRRSFKMRDLSVRFYKILLASADDLLPEGQGEIEVGQAAADPKDIL